MLLIVKKFHVSAAYRINKKGWDKAYTGTNLDITVGYSGPVDPVLGMIVNINEVKDVVSKVLEPFDHACIAEETVFTKESLLEYVLQSLRDKLSATAIGAGVLQYLQVAENSGISLEWERSAIRGKRAFQAGEPGWHTQFWNPIRGELIVPGHIPEAPEPAPGFATSLVDVDVLLLHSRRMIQQQAAGCQIQWSLAGGEYQLSTDGERILLTQYTFFDKAHALGNSTLTTEENEAIFGPCSEQHGHRYRFGITMNTNLEEFSRHRRLLSGFVEDMRRFLHQAQALDIPVMTGENIISLMTQQLRQPMGQLFGGVTLQETDSIYFLEVEEGWTGL